MVTAYGTSTAAPTSERLRTAQLYALRSNSIVALFRTRRRLVLRFSYMRAALFWRSCQAFPSGPVSRAGEQIASMTEENRRFREEPKKPSICNVEPVSGD